MAVIVAYMMISILALMLLLIALLIAPLPNKLEALKHNREVNRQETVKTLAKGE
jgi:hypothetical protein